MTQKNLAALGIPFLILLFLSLSSFFIVPQTQQTLVVQFGEIVRVIQSPGLKIKIPFVQDVLYYDKRMLNFDVSAIEVTLSDQKRVVVDMFTRYRIMDPVKFYKTVRDENGAEIRLATLATGTLRSTLGHTPLSTLLSLERTSVMNKIRHQVNEGTKDFGIEVVEIKMRRADLPKANSEAIFNRMISERRQEAAAFRAQGEEMGQTIQANADRECTFIVAEAEKQAQILRGEGDAQAAQLLREAYKIDPAFALFYQTLDTYKKALFDQTTYILSPNNDFLKLLRKNTLH